MSDGLPTSRTWAGSLLAAAPLVALQTTTTPSPGVGPEGLFDYWPALVRAGWFAVGFVAVALVGRLLVEPALARVVRRRNRNNPTLRDALLRYFRVLVLLFAVFVGAGVAGYGRFLGNSALILSAVTLAIGVAGQEVIGSLVSGAALVVDPEFNVGNYIEWPDGEGTVRSITLRVTRVQTRNGELVTIPNTVLTSESVTRPFGRGNYRVFEQIGLAYEDDIDEAMELLEEATTSIEGIRSEPSPNAYVEELGGDAVEVRVYYWIGEPHRNDVLDIRSEYARTVKARLEEAGITINPATQRDLRGRIEVDDAA